MMVLATLTAVSSAFENFFSVVLWVVMGGSAIVGFVQFVMGIVDFVKNPSRPRFTGGGSGGDSEDWTSSSSLLRSIDF